MLKSPRGALLRSLALPGWGQFYNERRMKGMAIAGVQTTLFAAFLIENRRCRGTDGRTARRDRFLLGLVGTVVYGALDAYVDAHFYGLEAEVSGTDMSVASLIQTEADGPECAIFFVVRFELMSESASAWIERPRAAFSPVIRKCVGYVH